MTDKEVEGRTESMLFFFFQMPNVKYAIASSVYYMSLILTYLLAKKIECNISVLRCFRKKLTDPTLHSLVTLPLLNYARESGKM